MVEAAALGVADAVARLAVFEIEGRGRAAPEDEVAAPAWKSKTVPLWSTCRRLAKEKSRRAIRIRRRMVEDFDVDAAPRGP